MALVAHCVALFAFTHATVYAVHLPFKISSVSSDRLLFASSLASGGTYGFKNVRNNVYTSQIFVAGQNFTVQLDTGSSDLWIDPSIPGVFSLPDTVDTGVHSSICYIDTTCADGPVVTGNITLGNFTVPVQAFINAVGTNATYAGINGLLGLGSTVTSASSIMIDLQDDQNVNSHTLMYNILDTYPSIGNFMTFLLSRTETGIADGGAFTIGETASGMDSIQQTPHVPVLLDTRWAFAINGMVIDGVPMIARSATFSSKLATGQLMTNLDTGTARAAAPPAFVDAIYREQPGAVFDGRSKYTLPCNNKVNVDIVIGNQTFPIHPIDMVVIADQGENPRTDDSEFICVGAFSYLQPGATDVDVILGDTFLRNVYSLYNFGNWTREHEQPPFIQLLSTTNADEASAEYDSLNNARLATRKSLQGSLSHKTSSASLPVSFIPSVSRTSLSILLLCYLIFVL